MVVNDVHILIVEDNPADLELALHALQKEKIGNRIHVARDGEEALAFFFGTNGNEPRKVEEMPRLVLLDLKLPKVDGLEVLRRIKSDPATKATPVVVMTSSKEEADLVSSYQTGVNSYIQKPVDFEQFRQIVRQFGMYWLIVNQPPPLAAFEMNKR
jgi:two-component system, response regulator